MKKTISLIIALFLITSPLTVVNAEDNPFGGITAKSIILVEQSTGQTIFEKNSHEKLPIASITKVMVLLIAMEQVDLGKMNMDTTMISGSKHAKEMGGSTIFLDEIEKMPLKDIVKGICINSGNDAAVALAENIGGTEEGFVKLMNDKAKQLGMNDTQFANATGLDMDGHYSSAYDVAVMSKELIKHQRILDFSSTWMDTLRDGKFQLSNTNKLLKLYPYADGLKTGSTDAAKYCLTATAKKDNMRLIAVLLGDATPDSRFKDAKTIFEWGFENYTIKNLGKAGEAVGKATVLKGDKDTVNLVLAKDVNAVMKKSEINNVKRDISFTDKLTAPVAKGQVVGKATLTAQAQTISTIDIITTAAVEKINFWQASIKLIRSWLSFGG